MKKVLLPFLLVMLALSSCTQSPLTGSELLNLPELLNGDLPTKNIDLDTSIVASTDDIEFVNNFMAKGALAPKSRAVVEGVDIAPVMILMYQRITADVSTNEYARSVAQLQGDFEYLRDKGITVIGFDDLRKIQEGYLAPPSPRMAILMFDDGWKDHINLAVPLLKQFGYKASFSISTSYIGDYGFMNWNDIAKLAEYRTVDKIPLFTLISHTVTHANLTEGANWSTEEGKIKYLNFLKRQLLQSKRAIETRIAPYTYIDAPMILALPYSVGGGTSEIIAMALRTGYSGIRTGDFGDYRQGSFFGAFNAFTEDPFNLPALQMYRETDIYALADYYSYLPTRLGFPTN